MLYSSSEVDQLALNTLSSTFDLQTAPIVKGYHHVYYYNEEINAHTYRIFQRYFVNDLLTIFL
jgi:hypothetical protein